MRSSLWRALLLLTVLGAACGDDDTEVRSAAPPPADAPTPEVRLRIEHHGGFVPVEVSLASFPTLVVADETAWMPGPQIAIYPAPAVPALQSAPLSGDDVRALADRLDEAADLFGDVDFGQPTVTDLPTTTIEAVVDGTTRRLAVDALDAVDGEGVEDGLDEQQRRARQQVRSLIAELQAVVDTPDRRWEPGLTPRVRVSSVPVDPGTETEGRTGGEIDGDGVPPGPPVPWPAGVPEPVVGPDTSFGCVAVSGPERDALLEAARSTNVLTTWELSSGPHRIVLRPLFPGEVDCP